MAESMYGLKRSHRCTEVSEANIGQGPVTVMGWVQKRRNLGSLIFIDLRDRSGLLQIVFDFYYVRLYRSALVSGGRAKDPR